MIPSLDALRLEVLVDRLTFSDRTAMDRKNKLAVLSSYLVQRHPLLGDQLAGDVAAEMIEKYRDCLDGLAEIQGKLLQPHQGRLAFQVHPELQWCRAHLDEDLLIAAGASAAARGSSVSVDMWNWRLLADPPSLALPRDLASILERPLAETHLHLGGAAPFFILWLPLLLGLLRLDVAANALADAIGQEMREVRPKEALAGIWLNRLFEAALVRFQLAAMVVEMDPRPTQHPFRQLLDSEGLAALSWSVDFEDFGTEKLSRLFRGLRDALYSGSNRNLRWLEANPKNEIPFRDYLALALHRSAALPIDDQPALGERWLLAQALTAASREGNSARGERLRSRLLRYVRLKQRILRLLIHGDGPSGLARFNWRHKRFDQSRRRLDMPDIREVWERATIRYQVRLLVLRWLKSNSNTIDDALSHHAPDALPLEPSLLEAVRGTERRLEIRTSPTVGVRHGRLLVAIAQGVRDALNELRRVLKWSSNSQEITRLPKFQVGLVLHLHKRQPKRDLPRTSVNQFRPSLLWLEDRPLWRSFIVGVDVAGLESNQGPENFAEEFRSIRHNNRTGGEQHPEASRHLGRTYHVGEDFRDLLTGIRQTAWAIDLLELEHGDRLGHGLAVGFDPGFWYSRRGQAITSLGEHLLDLLWAADRLPLPDSQPFLNRLSDVAGALSTTLISRYSDWFRQRKEAQDPLPITDIELAAELAKSLKKSSKGLISFRVDAAWEKALWKLQEKVLATIDQRGIFIEANPTSNLQVSRLDSYHQHPIFRWHPPTKKDDGLKISVSTDDPEVFRVSLRAELAFLFDACQHHELIRNGSGTSSRREALDWINRLRQDSFDSSFLFQTSPSGQDLYAALVRLLGS